MVSAQTHPLLRQSLSTAPLPGGGAVWVAPSPGSRCHALLHVDFGAVDGLPDPGAPELPEGIAHFLEHRLFEKADGDISERFSDLGAQVDAQTGLTGTSYSFTCGAGAFDRCLRLLFELAGDGDFSAPGIERERGIIEREIDLFDDSVEWVAFQAALQALYPGQRIAADIAGTPQSLARIDAPLLQAAHRRFYHAGAVQLIACGPVDAAAVVETAARCLIAWPPPPLDPHPRAWLAATPADVEVRRSLPRPRRLLVFPAPDPVGGESLLRRELACEIGLDILFGASSRFFCEQYELGLIDGETFGGEVHLEASYGFSLLGGDADHPDRLQEAIAAELRRAARDGSVEGDFEPAWRRVFGEMVCRWEDVESSCGLIEAAVLRGCHPFELVDLYAGEVALRSDEVAAAVHHCLAPDAAVTATVLPEGP